MAISRDKIPLAGAAGTAGIVLTVVGYIVTSNLFVTPDNLNSSLETVVERMRRERAEDYVSKNDYQRDMNELRATLFEIRTDIKRLITGNNH